MYLSLAESSLTSCKPSPYDMLRFLGLPSNTLLPASNDSEFGVKTLSLRRDSFLPPTSLEGCTGEGPPPLPPGLCGSYWAAL